MWSAKIYKTPETKITRANCLNVSKSDASYIITSQ